MAKVDFCTIKIEDTMLASTIDLLCRRYGYQENIYDSKVELNVPNEESKEDFVKRKLKELVRQEISDQRKVEFSEIDDGIV